jgi:hypothetical protein
LQIKHEQPGKYKDSVYFRKDLTAGGQLATGNRQQARKRSKKVLTPE